MAILLKREMPETCFVCPCYNDGYCYGLKYDPDNEYFREVSYKNYDKTRREDCPLIEIPDVYIDISKALMTELCNKVCTDIPVAPLHLPHEEGKDAD